MHPHIPTAFGSHWLRAEGIFILLETMQPYNKTCVAACDVCMYYNIRLAPYSCVLVLTSPFMFQRDVKLSPG